MSQNKAVRILTSGTAHIVDVPYPTLPADDYIIVKTTAVAVNPTDWKHVDRADQVGAGTSYIGCDYAGTVVEVGPAVTKKFNKGDRIAGPVNGA
jgi:NADPH:quinone reductase-like Zn-dependent oxidoreductase